MSSWTLVPHTMISPEIPYDFSKNSTHWHGSKTLLAGCVFIHGSNVVPAFQQKCLPCH